MLSQRLRRKGYDVVVPPTANPHCELIRDHRFDLILLDVMMPGLNGMEVLKKLRETHAAIDLPIIMATGRGESEEIVKALGLGANDYVTKPLDFPVVLARVRTHLAAETDGRAAQGARAEPGRAEPGAGTDQCATREGQRPDVSRPEGGGADPGDVPAPRVTAGSRRGLRVDLPALRRACRRRPERHPARRGRIGLYVLDVSGHGVAAALLSVTLSRFLSHPSEPFSILGRGGAVRETLEIAPPAEVADRLNRLFPFDTSIEQFATMIYGVLNSVTGEFRYVSAGHPGPVHLPAGARPVDPRKRRFPDRPGARNPIRSGPCAWRRATGCTSTPMASPRRWTGPASSSVITGCSRRSAEAALSHCRKASPPLDEIERWRGAAGAQDDVVHPRGRNLGRNRARVSPNSSLYPHERTNRVVAARSGWRRDSSPERAELTGQVRVGSRASHRVPGLEEKCG